MNIEDIMKKADARYAVKKMEKGMDLRYCAPEQYPTIQSDQVRALAEVLVEEFNKEIGVKL